MGRFWSTPHHRALVKIRQYSKLNVGTRLQPEIPELYWSEHTITPNKRSLSIYLQTCAVQKQFSELKFPQIGLLKPKIR